MKKTVSIVTSIVVALSGCASATKDLTPSYVSPYQYQSYSCQQISEESMRVQRRAQELGGRLDEAASNDAAITTAGIILFWPALFFLGGTKNQEAEYSRVKGEYDALHQASIAKNCFATNTLSQPVAVSQIENTKQSTTPEVSSAALSPEKPTPSIAQFEPAPLSLGGYPILDLGAQLGFVGQETTSSTGSTNSVPLANAVFVDIRYGRLFATIEVKANLKTTSMSGWNDEPCKRNDFLWKRSTGRTFENINCASISHISNFYGSPTGVHQQYLGRFKRVGLDIPPTIVRLVFTRHHNQGRRLVYTVSLNPELFGIVRDAEPIWGANSWHKEFIVNDPKKVEFIARLTRWAEDVQNRMDTAFDKNSSAFVGLPPLNTYLVGLGTFARVN